MPGHISPKNKGNMVLFDLLGKGPKVYSSCIYFACALLGWSREDLNLQFPNIALIKLDVDGFSGSDFIFHDHTPPNCLMPSRLAGIQGILEQKFSVNKTEKAEASFLCA